MSTDRAIIPLDVEAPPPLAPLTHEVVHPANIALEERRRRANPLSWLQVLRAKIALGLMRDKARQYHDLAARARAIRDQAKKLPQAERGQLRDLYQITLHDMDKYEAAYQQYKALARRLEDHYLAVERNKIERAEFLALDKETSIYAKLIRERWNRLGYCHEYKVDNEIRRDSVHFARADVSPDSIWFKIAASSKTIFGWKTDLPYGVKVGDLVKDETLFELSVVCQRQVQSVTNLNGAWIRVNRLSSPDGLRDYLSYKQVMEHYPVWCADRLPVCAGVGEHGIVKWLNFADYPHWLIGGFTGGGKSNLINVIISTIIAKHSPAIVRVVMIDLKGGLELSHYDGLPHLLVPVITQVNRVAAVLSQVYAEMEKRFDLMRDVKAKRIEIYNAKVDEDKRLPRIILVCDEFATLKGRGDVSKTIMESFLQISNRGRAVGIHLILCTQHSSVDIIPGPLKTNLNVRMAGRMPTSSASMTVLGIGDAANLPNVPGRMVMLLGNDPEQVQTPHIKDEDVAEALQTAKTWGDVAEYELPEPKVNESWTPERIIKFSLTHMGGLLAGVKLYEAIQDEGISRGEVFALVEAVEAMPEIIHNDKRYEVKHEGRGGRTRYLREIEPEKESQE